MTNGIAFSDRQIEQLTGLFHSQRESIIDELKAYVDGKFEEQDQRIVAQFAEERRYVEAKFADERAYYRQLIKEVLNDLRQQLKRLDERTDEDNTAALKDIEDFKQRLAVVESAVAKLQAA